MALHTARLGDLTIDDERSFRHVALYHKLKRVLIDDGYPFRVPGPGSPRATWDRIVFLNLTYWSAAEPADVLVDRHIAADVVAHVAWHHLARRAVIDSAPGLSADALMFGESIASAFDLYLVGRLLGHSPDSEFLGTQVPAMSDAAENAGLSEEAFETLLQSTVDDPERAFEDLRALLFDAGTTLVHCATVDQASDALAKFDGHRFGPLLHHYALSNWVLYARAYASERLAPDPTVRALDATLRAAPVSLDWLENQWLP